MEPAQAEAVLELAPDPYAVEPLDRLTLPLPELEDFRKLIFWLMYRRGPHGTGTNLTRTDILDMPVDEILWTWEYLREVWEEETRAIRAQHSR